VGEEFFCTNRAYCGGQFLSPDPLCPDCPYETSDLFHGTSGRYFYQYYCGLDPVVMGTDLDISEISREAAR